MSHLPGVLTPGHWPLVAKIRKLQRLLSISVSLTLAGPFSLGTSLSWNPPVLNSIPRVLWDSSVIGWALRHDCESTLWNGNGMVTRTAGNCCYQRHFQANPIASASVQGGWSLGCLLEPCHKNKGFTARLMSAWTPLFTSCLSWVSRPPTPSSRFAHLQKLDSDTLFWKTIVGNTCEKYLEFKYSIRVCHYSQQKDVGVLVYAMSIFLLWKWYAQKWVHCKWHETKWQNMESQDWPQKIWVQKAA